jgi:hypothetical protein
MVSKLIRLIEAEKRDAFRFAVFLIILMELALFGRAFLGYYRADWAYSEFLINYSAGFVRRGLSGTCVLMVYRLTTVDPYFIIVLGLMGVMIGVVYCFVYLLRRSSTGGLSSVLLMFSPALVLAAPLSGTFLRKDWLLIFGILIHGVALRMLGSSKIGVPKYLTFLSGLIAYLAVVILCHEIEIFMLPAHLILILASFQYMPERWKGPCKGMGCVLAVSQLICFMGMVVFNGSSGMAAQIFQQLPHEFRADENVISSLGWTFKQNFAIIQDLLTNPVALTVYTVCWLAGPVAIYFLLKGKRSAAYDWPLLLSVGPLLMLFFLGCDWGRWIVIISFTIFTIMTATRQPLYVDPSKDERKTNGRRFRNRVVCAMFVLGLFCCSLLVHVPHCCPQGLKGLTSPVVDHIEEALTGIVF